MMRDLPFDKSEAGGDACTGDEVRDLPLQVFEGVSRVARAGAYVTGGAVMAENGSPAPVPQSHDSLFAGWSEVDPQPNAPSPVLTFPDQVPEASAPDSGLPAGPPIAPVGVAVPAAEGSAGGTTPVLGLPGELPAQADLPAPGPLLAAGSVGPDSEKVFGLPSGQPSATLLDGVGSQLLGGWELPSVASLPLTFPGAAELPAVSQVMPGLSDLPSMIEHTFEGIGSGDGILVETDSQFQVHVGLNGIQVVADSQVTVEVGQIGQQLDQFSTTLGNDLNATSAALKQGITQTENALGQGISQTSNTIGQGISQTSNTIGQGISQTSSSVGQGISQTSSSVGQGMSQTASSLGSGVSQTSQTSVGTGLTQTPASVSPGSDLQPVSATPLQTTIQPAAASHPIANVASGTAAAAPLTVAAGPTFGGHASPTDHPQPVQAPTDALRAGPPVAAPAAAPTPPLAPPANADQPAPGSAPVADAGRPNGAEQPPREAAPAPVPHDAPQSSTAGGESGPANQSTQTQPSHGAGDDPAHNGTPGQERGDSWNDDQGPQHAPAAGGGGANPAPQNHAPAPNHAPPPNQLPPPAPHAPPPGDPVPAHPLPPGGVHPPVVPEPGLLPHLLPSLLSPAEHFTAANVGLWETDSHNLASAQLPAMDHPFDPHFPLS